jgi:hypothetical protein
LEDIITLASSQTLFTEFPNKPLGMGEVVDRDVVASYFDGARKVADLCSMVSR